MLWSMIYDAYIIYIYIYIYHISMIHDLQKCFKNWLVVSTPQSVGSILLNIWKNKIRVPSHQPDNDLIMIKISMLWSMIYDAYIIYIYHISMIHDLYSASKTIFHGNSLIHSFFLPSRGGENWFKKKKTINFVCSKFSWSLVVVWSCLKCLD